MKTNKLFRIIAVVMMLVISTFTFGCQSKEEKFDRAEDKLAIITLALEPYETKVDDYPKDLQAKRKLIEAINKYEKESSELLNELDSLAKGNEKLEKRSKKNRRIVKNAISVLTEKATSR